MATTTDSLNPREFDDPDFQGIYDSLKIAAESKNQSQQVAVLRVVSEKALALAGKRGAQ